MKITEDVLARGALLNDRVSDLSHSLLKPDSTQPKLVLSFDLFCLLLEYSAHEANLDPADERIMVPLLMQDEILFETGSRRLVVEVDFFSPANYMHIS